MPTCPIILSSISWGSSDTWQSFATTAPHLARSMCPSLISSSSAPAPAPASSASSKRPSTPSFLDEELHPSKRPHGMCWTLEPGSPPLSAAAPEEEVPLLDARSVHEEEEDEDEVPRRKLDKGKGKAIDFELPDVPDEVWGRVFELYYRDLEDGE